MSQTEIINNVEDAAWDSHVAASPQGSVFASSRFLRALGETCERLMVIENGVPVLAVPVLLRDETPLAQPYDFTQYIGPMFSAEFEGQPGHRRIPLRLRILESLIEQLAARWPQISFSLHPAFEDIRAFQWFHYHEPELGRFAINVAYTGQLPLQGINGIDSLLEGARSVRRQEYRKVESLGFTLEEARDHVALDRLHDLTFQRQGITREEHEVRLLDSITTTALQEGFGECLIARTPTNEAASAVLFLRDQSTAYYLFGAGDPELRKTGAGTWLMFKAIERARLAGCKTVDFVGINSPNRGDFKTSFGALPVPYFNLRWNRPQ